MINEAQELKRCSKCGVEKVVGDFYKRRCKCKSCIIKHNAEYRKMLSPAQKEALRARGLNYRIKNKETLKIKNKEWADNNKEKIKKYRSKNRIKYRMALNLWIKKNPLKHKEMQKKARKKKVELLQNCYVNERMKRCGIPSDKVDLLNAYRNLMKFKRLIREKKNGKFKHNQVNG